MEAFLIVINVFLILSAIVLIVAVLMQQGNTANLGVIGGGAETFLGKNKARGLEGKLEMVTKISAALFVVLAILATALMAKVNNQKNAVPPVTPSTGTSETVITPDTTLEDLIGEDPAASVAPTADEASEGADATTEGAATGDETTATEPDAE